MKPGAIFDEKKRKVKAEKVISVLRDGASLDSATMLLDVGCGAGRCTKWYAREVAFCVGIDVDRSALRSAQDYVSEKNTTFLEMNSEKMGFPDETFDVVVCSHIYEHVPSAQALLSEIHRVLKPGGTCYFAAGNRIRWMEPHYKLPLLSVLPKPLAHRYMKLSGKGNHYYETHQTYWGLRRLVSGFELTDYTYRIVEDPEKFRSLDVLKPGTLKQKLSLLALRAAYFVCPTYVWLLSKPARVDPCG